jgi:hypothetical protein
MKPLWVLALVACGSSPGTKEICTQAVCPAGGHTYQFCSDGNACRYVGSDNRAFPCTDCSHCATAANNIGAWCSSFSTGGTTGGGGFDMSHPTVSLPDLSHSTIGATCSSIIDCRDGTNPTCRKSATSSTGMCTADCTTDGDCGPGNVCIFQGGPTPGACARPCLAPGDCGPGLGCWVTLDRQACWPVDGVAEFGQPLTLNCDPTVAGCNGTGGCSRQILGAGLAGVCRQGCDIGSSQCPSLGGFQQSCYFADESIDAMNQPTGDKLKQPICLPDVPVGSPPSFIPDGAECLDPDSMMHYFDICLPGSQCETYTLAAGATPDNRCHRLCYLGSFMRDLDGGVAVTCPAGQTCHDSFGTTGSALPVGLCK